MPELPEAEYMVRRLRESAPAAVIRRVRVLRAGTAERGLARRATGAVESYGRRAKCVLLHMASGWIVRIQLGMTGHVYWVESAKTLPEYTRLAFDLEDGSAIAFEDVRVFGYVSALRDLTTLGYGPEPLDDAFTWQQLRDASAGLRQPVKPFLLDQKRVAGLGNIWAAESLWRARIDPLRAVTSVTGAEWRRLHAAIRVTLEEAIERSFAVTLGPADFPEADLHGAAVYGREGERCRRCPGVILRVVQAARATFFCPRCQR